MEMLMAPRDAVRALDLPGGAADGLQQGGHTSLKEPCGRPSINEPMGQTKRQRWSGTLLQPPASSLRVAESPGPTGGRGVPPLSVCQK